MTTAIQRQQDGTITLTITIPWETVEKTQEKVVSNLASKANVAGFRKGKAPKTLVKDTIEKETLREEVLKELLPNAYTQAVKEHSLTPIMNPKLHVEELADGKDWRFSAVTCEMPQVDLRGYKDEVRKVTAKSKIIVPGKEEKEVSIDEIIAAILTSVQLTIPHILLESEVDRLLSQTLDEIKKLGLTLDQYLSSTGKTADALRADYTKKATNDITFEFTLQKIADEQHITVEEKEIDEAILKAQNETEKKHLEANRYLLSSIIRQQKALDFLRHL